MDLSKKELAAFSVSKVVAAMAQGGLKSTGSLEGEVLAGYAAEAGRFYDACRMYIPMQLIARDMTAAGTSGSNFLVGNQQTSPWDIVRPYSVTQRAGVRILTGLRDNLVMPMVSGTTTAHWLASEAVTAIGESTPTVGQKVLSPKAAGALVDVTHQFMRQAKGQEEFLRWEMTRTVGNLIDGAIINGSGSAGEPQGIVGATGVGAVSGTSLGWSGLTTMQQTASAANTELNAWIGTPAVRQLLSNRERSSGNGNGYCWDSGKVLGVDAFASTQCPTASLVCGDFNQVLLGIWSDGFELHINPSDFSRGIYAARVLVHCDVGLLNPTAFAVSQSIT